jgi:hypothetical protein
LREKRAWKLRVNQQINRASFKPCSPEPESDLQNWGWNQNLNLFYLILNFFNKELDTKFAQKNISEEPEPEGLDSRGRE